VSERGVFAVDRGLFDHPRFAPEPFTEREAWQWMIGEAAYRAHTRRVGSATVSLSRGQMAHSIRFMAEKWKWTEARVRRFLSRLKGAPPKIDAMIDAAIDAGVTVVTICNYDKYQKVSLPSDAPADAAIDAPTTHQRRRVEVKEIQEEEGGGGSAREADPACTLASEVMVVLGIDPLHPPPGWYGAPMRLRCGLASGWTAEVVLLTARKIAAGKRDGPPESFAYLEKPIAREHALAGRAVPIVEISTKPEVVHARTGNQRRSFREVAAGMLADGGAGEGHAEAGGFRRPPELRLLAGNHDAEFLPQGGRR
jgi:hypothetical protein